LQAALELRRTQAAYESTRQTAASSPIESGRQPAQGTRGDMTEVYEANEGEMDCQGDNSNTGDNTKMTSSRATSAPLLSMDGELQERGEEGRRAASGLSAGDASLGE